MDSTELLARIAKGENIHLEFKERPIHENDLAASIVAFANTDGGQILFGVNDAGEIRGVNDPDALMRFADNVAFNNCEPPVLIVQETVRDEEGRVVVVINVPKGKQRPYRTNRGLYYVRTTSGRRQASREELLRMFQGTESLFFDETPILRATISDLSQQSIERLIRDVQTRGLDVAAIPAERLLLNWRLLTKVNDRLHPTLSGALFLARAPQDFIPYAYISALSIPGSDISVEPLDQKHIDGRIADVLEDAMRFLYIHLRRPHKIEGLKPEVTPELPVEVLREALVNAVAHRDYTIPAPVRLLVFEDRIEVRTPGQLPNTVTVDALKAGVHVLRNPAVYNILLKIGMVTDAGSGIPRMIRLVREAVGREVEFHLSPGEFTVSIPRPIYSRA